ncbi:MAG TPA: cobalamin-dependent protein [Anaerolineae bacterium]|nr:cobalamin-dependent protein [Anaerolineae bacterium]
MRVLLINPPRPAHSLWNPDAARLPPLALEYLAASPPPEAEVRILDAEADGLDASDVVGEAEAFQPDWVGLTALALPWVATAVALSRQLKQAGLSAPIAMGGAATTAVAPEIIASGCVDFVVQGEGEIAFRQLVSGADPRQVAGLCYRDDGAVVSTPAASPLPDLDAHLPARICDRARYTAFGKRLDAIESSRGSPTSGWRARSAASVVGEIADLVSRGAELIMVLDDHFMADIGRVRHICEELIQRQVRPWMWCHADVLAIRQQPEIVAKMREAGFVVQLLTVQPCDVADASRRDNLRQAVQALHECDVALWATLLIDGLQPDRAQRWSMIEFARELDLEFAQIGFATPYPGTPLYDECRRKGLLLAHDWEDYNPHHRVCGEDVSPESAYATLRELYKAYYLRQEFALPRMWTRLRAENPHLAKLIQVFNPAGIKTARDVVREGLLKSAWPTLLHHYCVPATLAEWSELIAVLKPLVNAHLAQQFPAYSTTVRMDTDIGSGSLAIVQGEVQAFSAQADGADVALRLDNAALRRLLIGLGADPGPTLNGAHTAGSPEALSDFQRYVEALQTYLRSWCTCGATVEPV